MGREPRVDCLGPLNDKAYNAYRKVPTGNPHEKLIADLMEEGVQVEECAVSMRGRGRSLPPSWPVRRCRGRRSAPPSPSRGPVSSRPPQGSTSQAVSGKVTAPASVETRITAEIRSGAASKRWAKTNA